MQSRSIDQKLLEISCKLKSQVVNVSITFFLQYQNESFTPFYLLYQAAYQQLKLKLETGIENATAFESNFLSNSVLQDIIASYIKENNLKNDAEQIFNAIPENQLEIVKAALKVQIHLLAAIKLADESNLLPTTALHHYFKNTCYDRDQFASNNEKIEFLLTQLEFYLSIDKQNKDSLPWELANKNLIDIDFKENNYFYKKTSKPLEFINDPEIEKIIKKQQQTISQELFKLKNINKLKQEVINLENKQQDLINDINQYHTLCSNFKNSYQNRKIDQDELISIEDKLAKIHNQLMLRINSIDNEIKSQKEQLKQQLSTPMDTLDLNKIVFDPINILSIEPFAQKVQLAMMLSKKINESQITLTNLAKQSNNMLNENTQKLLNDNLILNWHHFCLHINNNLSQALNYANKICPNPLKNIFNKKIYQGLDFDYGEALNNDHSIINLLNEDYHLIKKQLETTYNTEENSRINKIHNTIEQLKEIAKTPINHYLTQQQQHFLNKKTTEINNTCKEYLNRVNSVSLPLLFKIKQKFHLSQTFKFSTHNHTQKRLNSVKPHLGKIICTIIGGLIGATIGMIIGAFATPLTLGLSIPLFGAIGFAHGAAIGLGIGHYIDQKRAGHCPTLYNNSFTEDQDTNDKRPTTSTRKLKTILKFKRGSDKKQSAKPLDNQDSKNQPIPFNQPKKPNLFESNPSCISTPNINQEVNKLGYTNPITVNVS